MVNIRPLTKEDLDEFILLETSLFKSSFPKADLNKELENNGLYIYGAFDEKLVGFVYGYFVIDTFEVFNIGVKKDYRRMHIASRLMQEVLNIKDLKVVNLEVANTNTGAISFYKSLGFKENGIRKGYYEDGSDAILMSLVKEEGIWEF